MAKIVFLENSLRIDKLGILQLSSILKTKGHEVDLVIDSEINIEEYIKSRGADFIMFSVVTGEHKWFFEKNKQLKTKFNYTSVFGGPHLTFFPEDALSDSNIDFVVQGPGEDIINSLVAGAFKQKLIRGSIPNDFSEYPFPDRSILYKYPVFKDSGLRRFICSRDCKNSCAYCFNHIFHRMYKNEKCNFFKHKPVEYIINEIKDTVDNYKTEMVYFNDDNLAEDKDWLLEFCDTYKNRIGLPFSGSVRADSVDQNILTKMSESGCNFLNIALESVNPSTQKLLRRGKITNSQIEEANEICKQLNIKVRMQNMIGLPVENPLEDALQTYEYNLKLDPTDSWVSIFQPFPKTDLWKYCIDNSLISEEKECLNFYDDTILNIPNSEKINNLHKWWFFGIRYKIPRDVIEMLLNISLTDENKKMVQDFRWKLSNKEIYGGK